MKKVLICASTFDERVENYTRLIRAIGGEPLYFIKTSELFADGDRKADLVRESDVGVVLLSSVDDYWILGAANASKKKYILVAGVDEQVPRVLLDHRFIEVARDDITAEVWLRCCFLPNGETG
jgi:hypothetical protein